MTTLKEYKAMMEGATDALNAVLCDPNGKCCIYGSDWDRKTVDEALEKLSIAGGNLAPNLIRVIELAEEALLEIEHSDECAQIVATRALSEIRKLKGE